MKKDLFEHPELIPAEIAEILDRYQEEFEGVMDYEDTEKMLKEVEAKGYTFDYYLDNEPYGLRPIGVKLEELEGFEKMENGGSANLEVWFANLPSDIKEKITGIKKSVPTEAWLHEAEAKWYSMSKKAKEEMYDKYSREAGLMASGGSAESDPRWFERLQNYVKDADKNLKDMAEKSGINFIEWKREILRDVNPHGTKTPQEQYELYVHRVGDIYQEFHKEKKAAGGKLAMPEKGTPEWHQLGIAYKTIKMPSEMAGVMGGMTKEEAWELLGKYGFKKAVHIFSANDVKEFVEKINSGIKAPYVNAYYSDLGGEKNVSVLLTVSLDDKSSWKYDILENSRYAKLHIYRDGTIEKFSGSLPKMRKAKAKSQQEVIDKINSYLNSVKMEKGGSAGSLEDIYEKYRAKDYWDTAHDIKRKKEERDYFASKGDEKAKAMTDADIEKFYAEKEKSDFFKYAEKVKKALDEKDSKWLRANLRYDQKITLELVEFYTGEKAGKNNKEIAAWIDKFASAPVMGKGGAVKNNFKNIMKNIFSAFADDGALITGGNYFGSPKMSDGGEADAVLSDEEKKERRRKFWAEVNEKNKKKIEERWATGKPKTREVFYVQGNYGSGWDDLTAHDTYYDAKKELRVYDANESYPHRVIKRRIKREDYEKGNYEAGGTASGKGGWFSGLFKKKKKYGRYQVSYVDHLGYEKRDFYDDYETANRAFETRKKDSSWIAFGEWGGVGEPNLYGEWKDVAYDKGMAQFEKGGRAGKKKSSKGKSASKKEYKKEDLEWNEIALRELREHEGDDSIVDSEPPHMDKGFEAENKNRSNIWYVFENEDDAKEYAIGMVKSDLENEPEIFNQDWLMGHVDEDSYIDSLESDIANWVKESPSSYSSFIDNEEPENDGEYSDDQIGRMIDGYTEDIKRDLIDFLKGLGYKGKSLFNQLKPHLDIDEAAEDSIKEDGVAHFLGRYDGKQIDLPSGAVAYKN